MGDAVNTKPAVVTEYDFFIVPSLSWVDRGAESRFVNHCRWVNKVSPTGAVGKRFGYMVLAPWFYRPVSTAWVMWQV